MGAHSKHRAQGMYRMEGWSGMTGRNLFAAAMIGVSAVGASQFVAAPNASAIGSGLGNYHKGDFKNFRFMAQINVPGSMGSGFFIAPNMIATSAHVVWDDKKEGLHPSAKVKVSYMDKNGNLQTAVGHRVYVDPGYKTGHNNRNDAAVIVLEKPVADVPHVALPGDGFDAPTGDLRARAFGFQKPGVTSTNIARAVWVAADKFGAGVSPDKVANILETDPGFANHRGKTVNSGEVNVKKDDSRSLFTASNENSSKNPVEAHLKGAPLYAGDSGGPLIMWDKSGKPVAVGLNTSGVNFGGYSWAKTDYAVRHALAEAEKDGFQRDIGNSKPWAEPSNFYEQQSKPLPSSAAGQQSGGQGEPPKTTPGSGNGEQQKSASGGGSGDSSSGGLKSSGSSGAGSSGAGGQQSPPSGPPSGGDQGGQHQNGSGGSQAHGSSAGGQSQSPQRSTQGGPGSSGSSSGDGGVGRGPAPVVPGQGGAVLGGQVQGGGGSGVPGQGGVTGEKPSVPGGEPDAAPRGGAPAGDAPGFAAGRGVYQVSPHVRAKIPTVAGKLIPGAGDVYGTYKLAEAQRKALEGFPTPEQAVERRNEAWKEYNRQRAENFSRGRDNKIADAEARISGKVNEEKNRVRGEYEQRIASASQADKDELGRQRDVELKRISDQAREELDTEKARINKEVAAEAIRTAPTEEDKAQWEADYEKGARKGAEEFYDATRGQQYPESAFKGGRDFVTSQFKLTFGREPRTQQERQEFANGMGFATGGFATSFGGEVGTFGANAVHKKEVDKRLEANLKALQANPPESYKTPDQKQLETILGNSDYQRKYDEDGPFDMFGVRPISNVKEHQTRTFGAAFVDQGEAKRRTEHFNEFKDAEKSLEGQGFKAKTAPDPLASSDDDQFSGRFIPSIAAPQAQLARTGMVPFKNAKGENDYINVYRDDHGDVTRIGSSDGGRQLTPQEASYVRQQLRQANKLSPSLDGELARIAGEPSFMTGDPARTAGGSDGGQAQAPGSTHSNPGTDPGGSGGGVQGDGSGPHVRQKRESGSGPAAEGGEQSRPSAAAMEGSGFTNAPASTPGGGSSPDTGAQGGTGTEPADAARSLPQQGPGGQSQSSRDAASVGEAPTAPGSAKAGDAVVTDPVKQPDNTASRAGDSVSGLTAGPDTADQAGAAGAGGTAAAGSVAGGSGRGAAAPAGGWLDAGVKPAEASPSRSAGAGAGQQAADAAKPAAGLQGSSKDAMASASQGAGDAVNDATGQAGGLVAERDGRPSAAASSGGSWLRGGTNWGGLLKVPSAAPGTLADQPVKPAREGAGPDGVTGAAPAGTAAPGEAGGIAAAGSGAGDSGKDAAASAGSVVLGLKAGERAGGAAQTASATADASALPVGGLLGSSEHAAAGAAGSALAAAGQAAEPVGNLDGSAVGGVAGPAAGSAGAAGGGQVPDAGALAKLRQWSQAGLGGQDASGGAAASGAAEAVKPAGGAAFAPVPAAAPVGGDKDTVIKNLGEFKETAAPGPVTSTAASTPAAPALGTSAAPSASGSGSVLGTVPAPSAPAVPGAPGPVTSAAGNTSAAPALGTSAAPSASGSGSVLGTVPAPSAPAVPGAPASLTETTPPASGMTGPAPALDTSAPSATPEAASGAAPAPAVEQPQPQQSPEAAAPVEAVPAAEAPTASAPAEQQAGT